jgi:hypothetical protein
MKTYKIVARCFLAGIRAVCVLALITWALVFVTALVFLPNDSFFSLRLHALSPLVWVTVGVFATGVLIELRRIKSKSPVVN